MVKPENPFHKGSIIWGLMEDDWSDLTLHQISEVLDTSVATVRASIYQIKIKTGYSVPYVRCDHRGRPIADAEN